MIALYQAIWRASGRQQIVLIVLSILVAGLAAVPLEYQKTIINTLTAAGEDLDAERRELYRLAAEMFALILFSLALKWALGYRSSIVGESTILLVRKRATGNFLDPEQRDTMRDERGTQAALLSAEVEEVGKFAGSAIAEPLMQLGTLVAVIGYITVDQPALGLIALLVVLPQVVVVVTTQRRINRLVADRVVMLRRAVDRVTAEQITGVQREVEELFDRIFEARRLIFIWKLSTKFALSALNGVGTVGVLLIGGFFVIEGREDVGSVVAATIGLSRLQQPWRQLVAFYRSLSIVRVKFELMREVGLRFHHPPGSSPEKLS